MDDLKKVIKDLKEALNENDVDTELLEKYKPVLDFDKYLEEKGYELIGRTKQDTDSKEFKVIVNDEKMFVRCDASLYDSKQFIYLDTYPQRVSNWWVYKYDESWEDYFAKAEKELLRFSEEVHEQRENLKERRNHRCPHCGQIMPKHLW